MSAERAVSSPATRAAGAGCSAGLRGFAWAAAAYLVAVALLLSWIVAGNDGKFTYMLDDPYIHMAMAKTIAAHGVYGVTPHAFSASSSSPVWTALLAAVYRATGPWDLLPLLLNVILSLLVLRFFAVRIPPLIGDRPAATAAILVFIALGIPLPLLTFNGLEHVLQILLSLHFLRLFLEHLDDPAAGTVPLRLLAALLPLVRYETLFLIGAAALLLAIRGRRRDAGTLLACAAAGVLLFGAFQILHGGRLLPNSVLIKGKCPPLGWSTGWFPFLDNALVGMSKNVHLLALLLSALLFRRLAEWRGVTLRSRADALPDLLLVTFVLHMTLAGHGDYYASRMFIRYDAWLAAFGFFAFLETACPVLAAGEPGAGRPAMAARWGAILFLLLLPAAVRGYHCLGFIERAARNVHDMHYQLAQFIRAAYPGDRVAVHDIGCVNYHADFRCVDLYGLGHTGFFELVQGRMLKTEDLSALCRSERVEIAVIWKRNFESEACALPKDWIPVGEWKIPDNAIMYEDRLTFFALSRSAENLLKRNLRSFAALLPDRIGQSGAYREGAD